MKQPRLTLAVHDPERAVALREAFWRAGWRVAAVDPASPRPQKLSTANVVIMDAAEIAGYRRRYRPFASALPTQARLLIVADDANLTDLLCLPRRVDGLLFLGEGLTYQQVELAVAGYSCLPRRMICLRPNPSWRRSFDLILSPAEQQVLGLLGKGFSNREIAESLQLSAAHAKTVVRQVLHKLGAGNRTTAGVMAARAARPK